MNAPIRIAALSLSSFLFLAAACNQRPEPATPVVASSPVAVAPIAAPAASAAAPAAAPAAVAPAVAPVAAPAAPSANALASADGEIPGTRVEIMELKRNSSGTVTLTFTMFSDAAGPLNFSNRVFGDQAFSEDYYSVGGVHLLDPVGKKKYLVVRDSANQCVCSNNVPAITKSKVSLWAKFPAPPEDVKTVTVVIPHFPPFDDLAIR